MKDLSEQGPVQVPRPNGFGMVRLLAVDALLSDVQLPLAEVGWCFHGLDFCWFKVWIGLVLPAFAVEVGGRMWNELSRGFSVEALNIGSGVVSTTHPSPND